MYTDNPSAAEGQTNLFDVVVLSTFLRINGCGLDVIRGTQPAINKNIHMLMNAMSGKETHALGLGYKLKIIPNLQTGFCTRAYHLGLFFCLLFLQRKATAQVRCYTAYWPCIFQWREWKKELGPCHLIGVQHCHVTSRSCSGPHNQSRPVQIINSQAAAVPAGDCGPSAGISARMLWQSAD